MYIFSIPVSKTDLQRNINAPFQQCKCNNIRIIKNNKSPRTSANPDLLTSQNLSKKKKKKDLLTSSALWVTGYDASRDCKPFAYFAAKVCAKWQLQRRRLTSEWRSRNDPRQRIEHWQHHCFFTSGCINTRWEPALQTLNGWLANTEFRTPAHGKTPIL